MITELGRDELVDLGARRPSASLITQAGYTLGVADEDGKPLVELLPPGYLGEVAAMLDAVTAQSSDRDLLAAEAQVQTGTQDGALRDAKVWRRKVAARGRRAEGQGKAVAEVLTAVGPARSVAAVAELLRQQVAALGEHLAAMGPGTDALQAEGARLRDALLAADATQETTRWSTLPSIVRDFYAAKGTLYVGLKVIHEAGQELHAADPPMAARYNLKILYA